MTTKKAVIVSFARTPISKFRGSLSALSAPELGSVAIKGALSRLGLGVDYDGSGTDGSPRIIEAYMGNVVSAGIGQAPCRQAGTCTLIDCFTPFQFLFPCSLI